MITKRNYVPGVSETITQEPAGTIAYNTNQYFVLDGYFKFSMADLVVYSGVAKTIVDPGKYILIIDQKYSDIEATYTAKSLYCQIKFIDPALNGEPFFVSGKNFGTFTDNDAVVAYIDDEVPVKINGWWAVVGADYYDKAEINTLIDGVESKGSENAIQVAGATAGSFKDSGISISNVVSDRKNIKGSSQKTAITDPTEYASVTVDTAEGSALEYGPAFLRVTGLVTTNREINASPATVDNNVPTWGQAKPKGATDTIQTKGADGTLKDSGVTVVDDGPVKRIGQVGLPEIAFSLNGDSTKSTVVNKADRVELLSTTSGGKRSTVAVGGLGSLHVTNDDGGGFTVPLTTTTQPIVSNFRIQHPDAQADNQSATRAQVLPAYGVYSAIRDTNVWTKATRVWTLPSGWVFRLGWENWTAGALTVTIPNVAGEYLIYLDVASKTLMATTGSRPDWGIGILVATLAYSQIAGDEISMQWETHGVRTKYDDDEAKADHNTVGSLFYLSSVSTPANLVFNGTVAGLNAGTMADEDKISSIASKTGATTNWAKFYYLGVAVSGKNKMERFPADFIGATQAQRNQIFVKDSDVGLGATGRAVFNNMTGTPALQTIATNSAMCIHFFGSDGVFDTSALVIGQREYTGSNFAQAVQSAREGVIDEIRSIKVNDGIARDAVHCGSIIISATGQIQYVDSAQTKLFIPPIQLSSGATIGDANSSVPTIDQVLTAGNSTTQPFTTSGSITSSANNIWSGNNTFVGNVLVPVADQAGEAVQKSQLDSGLAGKVSKAGDTMTGQLSLYRNIPFTSSPATVEYTDLLEIGQTDPDASVFGGRVYGFDCKLAGNADGFTITQRSLPRGQSGGVGTPIDEFSWGQSGIVFHRIPSIPDATSDTHSVNRRSVKDAPITGVTPVNSAIVDGDTVSTIASKSQGQITGLQTSLSGKQPLATDLTNFVNTATVNSSGDVAINGTIATDFFSGYSTVSQGPSWFGASDFGGYRCGSNCYLTEGLQWKISSSPTARPHLMAFSETSGAVYFYCGTAGSVGSDAGLAQTVSWDSNGNIDAKVTGISPVNTPVADGNTLAQAVSRLQGQIDRSGKSTAYTSGTSITLASGECVEFVGAISHPTGSAGIDIVTASGLQEVLHSSNYGTPTATQTSRFSFSGRYFVEVSITVKNYNGATTAHCRYTTRSQSQGVPVAVDEFDLLLPLATFNVDCTVSTYQLRTKFF